MSNTWFTQLYNGLSEGYVTLFSLDQDGNRYTDWSPVQDHLQIEKLINDHRDTCDVWFGVATRREQLQGRRGGAADCEYLPALWVDIDVAGPNHKTAATLPPDLESAVELVMAFPQPPTAIVSSGGGLQAWWLFAEPIPVNDELRSMLDRWGKTWIQLGKEKGWHVDNVFDLARIMRVPGTFNRKNDPTPVELLNAKWDRRYNLDDLDQWTIDEEPPKPPQSNDDLLSVPYFGPERPGDAFNQVRTGSDILHALGWTLGRRDGNGDEHWVRPGKDPRHGSSATVYADDCHTTIWSDTVAAETGCELRRPYDPFGLFTALVHRGDFKRASDELEAQGYGTKLRKKDDLVWLEPQPQIRLPLLDLQKLYEDDMSEADWLLEPLIAKARSHALFAGAKQGKSLLVLAACAALASGRPFLDYRGGAPMDILYVDFEMTRQDVRDRLEDFGYPDWRELKAHFHYCLLPTIPGLDKPAGAPYVVETAQALHAKLVVIDTTARAVEGPENDADTFKAFYRWTGQQLKGHNIAWIRLDHAGKESERGQRGSSGKNDDVDVVWRLTRRDWGVQLDATHHRMNWVPDTLELSLVDENGGQTYKMAQRSWPEGTKVIALQLERLGVDIGASYREARTTLKKNGIVSTTDVVRAALRWRKTRPPMDFVPSYLLDSEED